MRVGMDAVRYCAVCGWTEDKAIHRPFWRNGVLIDEPYGHKFKPSKMTRLQASALKRKLYERLRTEE